MLSEVWSCEKERDPFHSIRVYGHQASKLVHSWQFIDLSLYSHRLLVRKQDLDSDSHKLHQELNLALDKRATELDGERDILAKALQDYSEGMILEQALHQVCTELGALEDQDVALCQEIIQETDKLSQLEEKVRQTLRYCLEPLGSSNTGGI